MPRSTFSSLLGDPAPRPSGARNGQWIQLDSYPPQYRWIEGGGSQGLVEPDVPGASARPTGIPEPDVPRGLNVSSLAPRGRAGAEATRSSNRGMADMLRTAAPLVGAAGGGLAGYLGGAATGALGGALGGLPAGGVGAIPGALIGGLTGAVSGGLGGAASGYGAGQALGDLGASSFDRRAEEAMDPMRERENRRAAVLQALMGLRGGR